MDAPSDACGLLSGRQAAALLGRELDLVPRQAWRVLQAGLAGEPLRTSSAHLYATSRVRELIARPHLTHQQLLEVVPQGLFVLRRLVPADSSPAEQARILQGGWDLAAMTRVIFRLFWRHARFAAVATVGGFVVAGFDVADLQTRDGFTHLELVPPGAWYGTVERHRLRTGSGSPWLFWPPPDESSTNRPLWQWPMRPVGHPAA